MGQHNQVTPHLARYARHPLPKGEGRYSMCSCCQPSPEGRGWPAVPMHFIGKRAG